MLKDGTVGLRPLQTEDVWLLYRWHNDPRVSDGLGVQRPFFATSMGEERRAVERMVSSTSERGYLIMDLSADKPLGWASLTGLDRRNASAELRVVMGEPSRWGRGRGVAAVRLLLDHAFLVLNLHRIQARVPEYDRRALDCLEACGFRREGTFREDHYRRGAYRSSVLLSVLKEERGGPG